MHWSTKRKTCWSVHRGIEEIKKRKWTCFDSLCESANWIPWGDAYKVVMARTRYTMALQERNRPSPFDIRCTLAPCTICYSWRKRNDEDVERRVVEIEKSLLTHKVLRPDCESNAALTRIGLNERKKNTLGHKGEFGLRFWVAWLYLCMTPFRGFVR